MYQTFSDIAAAYSDDYSNASWRSAQSFRAAWSVINDKQYGNDIEAYEKALLQWINAVHGVLTDQQIPITRVQRLNSMLYRGKHYMSQLTELATAQMGQARAGRIDFDRVQIVLNHIGKAVDQHVADMVSYEPAISVMPTNDQEQDKVAAKLNKMCLDHYWDRWRLITEFQTFHQRKKIHGETFAFVDWNPAAGDIHPKYKEYLRIQEDQGKDPNAPMPLLDEQGNAILGSDNEPLYLNQPLKTGDVRFSLEYACRVLYPTPESNLWKDVPYLFRNVWMDIDEVRARWVKSANKIKGDLLFNPGEGPFSRELTEKVLVRFMYHKPTEFLPDGYYCASTKDAFLEASSYPFNHEHLPCIRGTDIDLDFDIKGMSFIQNLSSLNHAMNNSMSMIMKNQALFAHPKYAAPRGAKVRYTDLGSEQGIYEYSGPQAPALMVNNSSPQDTWRVMDSMRSSFDTLSQIYAPSRGEGIDGITANVALRMIDSQEKKLHKPSINKHSDNVETLGYLTLKTLGTFRDPEDKMLIEILGKNNERYLKYFDISNLSRAWRCKIKRSSGLPDEPAAKTQTVMDLADRFEGIWENDEILEYLDIERPEKLIQSATVARQTAESEVEDILSGVPNVPEPAETDEIIPKYSVYSKAVQSRAFKEMLPEVQQRMNLQIIAAEYIIVKKMGRNPVFAQMIMQKFPNFPTVFPDQSMQQPFALSLAPPPMPTDPLGNPVGGVDPAMDSATAASPSPQEAVPAEQSLPTPSPQDQQALDTSGALP